MKGAAAGRAFVFGGPYRRKSGATPGPWPQCGFPPPPGRTIVCREREGGPPRPQRGEPIRCLRSLAYPGEIFPGEKRVAAAPEVVQKLIGLGFSVIIEKGAGDPSDFYDDAFTAAGAKIVATAGDVWSGADIVQVPRADRCVKSRRSGEGQTLISFIWPAQNPELMEKLKARKATVLAMDAVPRLVPCAKMDALTSQAGVSGYRAVIEAANAFGRYFNGQITAAGKIPPARCSSPAQASPAWRRSARRPASAPSCAPTTRARKSPIRSSRSAANSSRSISRKKARAAAATRQGDERRFPGRATRDVRQAGGRLRHHHHDGAHSRQAQPKLITADMVKP